MLTKYFVKNFYVLCKLWVFLCIYLLSKFYFLNCILFFIYFCLLSKHTLMWCILNIRWKVSKHWNLISWFKNGFSSSKDKSINKQFKELSHLYTEDIWQQSLEKHGYCIAKRKYNKLLNIWNRWLYENLCSTPFNGFT